MRLILILLVLVQQSACSNGEKSTVDFSETTSVEYHFGDASVSPTYHRSHSITLTKTELHFVVDSYGDIIKDTTITVDTSQLNKVIKALETANIMNCKSEGDDGCTGGTSNSVTVLKGTETIFKGSAYHCGGTASGTLCGDIDMVRNAMRAGIAPEVFDHE